MQIRVFCRVRPGAESAVTCLPDGLTVRVDGQTEGIKEGVKDCTFAFDKVFGHYSSQAEVFAEVSNMVQSALDGYKVCPASNWDNSQVTSKLITTSPWNHIIQHNIQNIYMSYW